MALSRDADYSMYLYTCNRCRSCAVEPSADRRSICPSYERMGFFAYSGGGKAYVAQGLLEGKIKPSQEAAEIAMSCLSCGACAEACPPGFDIMSFIRDLRHHLVQKGCFANDAHREVIGRLREAGNPWGKPFPASELPAYHGQEVLIWRGCRERIHPAVLNSVTRVLDAASVSYGVVAGEVCCGAPFLELGDKDGFLEHAEKTLELLENAGAERVVVLCPHCAYAMTVDYMEVGVPESEPVTLPSFLAELIAEGRIELDTSRPSVVTCHDPCRLGRVLEDINPPREVLSAMNIEVREMDRNGAWTYCCGAGGWQSETASEVSTHATQERIGEARLTGASAIVTSCSYCADRLSRGKADMPVSHLADEVARRLTK
ncbi:MAG: (Fe-S)-binding protein [bacterium]